MIIEKLNPKDNDKYEDLSINFGTVFNSFSWLKIFEDKIQIYGIFDDGNNLIGGFALYKQNRFGLTIYRDPPFTPFVGPFLNIKAKNPVAIMDYWKEILTLMANVFNHLSYSVISVSLDKRIIDTQPFIWRKFKVTPGYTYILDLEKQIEEIEKDMSANKRNHIKKALKDNLIVKKTDSYETVKSLVLKTFSRQNKTIRTEYLDKILFDYANANNSFAFVVFKEGNAISCSFFVYDKTTSYNLLSGYDDDNSHHGAGVLGMWEAIKHAKSMGLKYFDFEGSMVPQIERYFRGFGGRLIPYFRVNKARLPIEILLKFIKRDIF